MLALLLAMGGAWAQGPTAAEINYDLYSGWTSIDERLFKASELPGFQAVTEDQAKSWTGVPSTGIVCLYYKFVADGHVKYVIFEDGVYEGSYEDNDLRCYDIYEDIEYNGYKKYFYTTGGGAIKLTPDATGKVWTLAETPDYNLDLNVVYYQKYALKEIPANWQVKVDGVDKTAAIDGDSLKITETAQVILTPDHPERVKKVILVDEAVLVTIDGVPLDITGCTTWADIIARNPGVLEDDDGWVAASGRGFLDLGDMVYTTDPYDPAQQSNYHWVLM